MIFDGIGKVLGAGMDVVKAPFRLLTGDVGAIGDVVKAPFKAAGGVIQTALGVATLPIRLPLMMAGSMFGTMGGSPAARMGAQNAVGGYMQQGGSPGYW